MASRGHRRPAEAEFFFLAQTVPLDLSVNPWWSLKVFSPLRTLQRPRGHQRPAKAEFFFWLKRLLLTSASIPDGPCQCPAPSGPSSGLEAIKVQPRPKFFLAQTFPFDLSVDPWCSLTVSGPLRTLQRPRGCQRPTEAEIYFWLKRLFLTSASIPDVPCQCPASSGPSSSLEAIKGRPRPKFFLAQTVPFDLNVNPSWSLPVSAPPQDPPAASKPFKANWGRNSFWLKRFL